MYLVDSELRLGWKNMEKIAIFQIALLASAQAQVPFFGGCPDYPVVQNFKVDQYTGRWFEIQKYFAIFEAGGSCIEAYYTDYGNGTVGVRNSQIQKFTRSARTIEGTARVVDSNGNGKLAVQFPSVPFAGEAPYWILDTDYKTYSIVWSCTDLSILNFQILWFLSRQRSPSKETRQRVYEKLTSLGIRTSLLTTTKQSDCEQNS